MFLIFEKVFGKNSLERNFKEFNSSKDIAQKKKSCIKDEELEGIIFFLCVKIASFSNTFGRNANQQMAA